MTEDVLRTPIEYLKGVGPKRAQLLQKELGIFTLDDLVHHYPFRYEDRSRIYPISSVEAGSTHVQLFGQLVAMQLTGKGRSQRLTALLEDQSGRIELVWFKGVKWLSQSLKQGSHYLVFGKPTRFQSSVNMVHPEMEEKEDGTIPKGLPLHPVYPSTEKLNNAGLGSRAVSRIMARALEKAGNAITESLSPGILDDLRMLPMPKPIIITITITSIVTD